MATLIEEANTGFRRQSCFTELIGIVKMFTSQMGQEESVGKRRIQPPESGHDMSWKIRHLRTAGKISHWQERFSLTVLDPKLQLLSRRTNVCKREICFSCCRLWDKCNTIRRRVALELQEMNEQ